MKALAKATYQEKDNWVLAVVPLANHGIVAAYSDGTVKLFPTKMSNSSSSSSFQPLKSFKAHDSTINSMKPIDGKDTFITCAEDKIRIWDLSKNSSTPVQEFSNDKGHKYLSLGVSEAQDLLAAGTELQGVDAEVHLWDLHTGKLIRTFADSHHDDVTDIKFHPSNKDFLMSGSTDGYVNIYDLSIEDEEDALYQVINYASIHSTNFISPYRIATLSHMETFAIHELEKDTSEELSAPTIPKDFGDIRESWQCEYVVDIFPGYVACGSNSKGQLIIYPFDSSNESVNTESNIMLLGGHGEEVVRAIHYDGPSGLIYTGGEDGCFKIWETTAQAIETPSSFYSSDPTADVEMEIDEEDNDKEDNADDEEKKEKKHKSKKHKKDKKDKEKKKKDKKDKHSSKSKKSSNKEKRFKPY